jgi:hypothetical protein
MTTDIERIWRDKSDDDLIEAASQLGDYTPEGQRVIRSELKRRGLEDPIEQVGEAALEATSEDAPPPRECSECRVALRYLGASALSGAAHLQGHALDVYACPQCGHVDFFIAVAGGDDDEASGA